MRDGVVPHLGERVVICQVNKCQRRINVVYMKKRDGVVPHLESDLWSVRSISVKVDWRK